MELILINKKTQEKYEYTVEDMNYGEKLYFRFSINTKNLPDGEYDLSLMDGEYLVLTDTLYIGDYEPITLQYKRGENTYIDVTLDAKLEEKTVSVDSVQTTVYPTEGIDAMTEVVIDAQPLYDSAYDSGKTDGYNEGYEVGYAESYDAGYEKGQEDIAANARVIDITENGIYTSKFSEIEWNVPEMNTDGFSNYADLRNIVYDTGIIPNENTRLEIWYKPDGYNGQYFAIFGTQKTSSVGIFKIVEYNNAYRMEWDSYAYNFSMTDGEWHHIIMSKADGLIIDGQQLTTWYDTTWREGNDWAIYINGNSSNVNDNANGCYGIIKIDDVVIIPTENGFLNQNTNELLPITKEGNYIYYEKPIAEGELYKTINVDVIPKISLKYYGLKFTYSTITEVPEWADFEGVTDMSYMFEKCNLLTTVPLFDTSNVTTMSYMFNECKSLTTVPLFDTSNVTTMSCMFNECSSLQTVPAFDTSNVTTMKNMFYVFGGNKNFVSLPKFDCSKVTDIGRYFSYYSNGMSNLTDVGGWENLSCNWNDTYGLATCPNLTYESCINVLNGLYDFVGNGSTETRTLKVHSNFLTTVGDEISIGTNKGWTITA